MKVTVFQLRITLADISPPVWRRALVGGNKTLTHLHWVIQKVMPWENCHLHVFEVAGVRYGDPRQLEDEGGHSDFDFWPEAKMRLDRLRLNEGDAYSYFYDFGDGWRHQILVEGITSDDPRYPGHPVCLDGQRACPKEDSGGPWGYEDILKLLADPRLPDPEGYRDWIGPKFDPERFDLAAANARLTRLK